MKVFIKLSAVLVVVLGFNSSIADDVTNSIKERTESPASICLVGDPCAAAPAPSASAEPRSGEQVYTASCGACHASGVSGAPKFGDAADWSNRLSSKGLETLYSNAINGINAMPAKGLCMDCSDEEIHGAIDYMLENSK
ncbi:cytochrome c5 family protein [uncultured Umboniibacter sp.]|uniref:c-type cytochrome n=1 Tax=uncultured Umboniibacter sp. TaxID=1798917 RepID=UPI00261FA353|nr:cytochrome c5 family protein [uncultured Umboniibacter sp.]